MEEIPKTVREIMSSPVITVTSDTTVRDALLTMHEKNIGAVVVVSGDEPVGIITERDILRGMVLYENLPDQPVSRIMSRKLVTCPPDTPILRAFIMMHENRIRRLPVVDEGKLVGIVTERDLLYWILKLVGYESGEQKT